ncbi:MAG: hypothetical protein M3072_00890 [Candidatus Dormibacteraeota bacterium]|nr:hypothetical protein [Candidatus Dormibacteraeota bacterium]
MIEIARQATEEQKFAEPLMELGLLEARWALDSGRNDLAGSLAEDLYRFAGSLGIDPFMRMRRALAGVGLLTIAEHNAGEIVPTGAQEPPHVKADDQSELLHCDLHSFVPNPYGTFPSD